MTDLYILLEFTVLGLLSSAVTALMALSFVLVYKGPRVVNFAVGEVMIGNAMGVPRNSVAVWIELTSTTPLGTSSTQS